VNWENLWPVIGVIAASLTATSFIPQIITQWRHPDRARVAYGTLAAFMLGSALWACYGIHLWDWIIIGANLFIFTNLGFLVVLQLLRDGARRRIKPPDLND